MGYRKEVIKMCIRPGKMKRTLQVHKCHCMFVPPQVLENLARKGIMEAVDSVHQSKLSREKREIRVTAVYELTSRKAAMQEFMSFEAVGTASRQVYDCQNQWKQRVNLIRGEDGSPADDDAANDVYDHAGRVRDYFIDVLGRNSIDDASMDIILNVHYGVKYQNAFWDGDEMTFGDGDGKIFTNFSKSLDVIAHELAHGVTQWTANLAYKGQSGALNEHFSDVFGSVITQHVEGQTADTADWLIGDEIMGPELKGEALRSMLEPGIAYDNELMGKDTQPGHMNDYYKGSADNYGVHINSGIPNKAFYLAATEMNLGTDKAALIWYNALQKLWPTANFNDAVKVIAQSAKDLANEGKVPKGSPQKVRAAFKAVGLPS
ncbi:Protease PrtS [Candidatus Methanoperedens nitroreducens]|uniref:Protease PrtS n=2 Tax=Candidatus Methanoperedens nitratireducens TaxID=1392998 RepID=A0A284VMI3_9EURY|nr:Protease PrtS [Candidatus Methanoperedens nitroreducens]